MKGKIIMKKSIFSLLTLASLSLLTGCFDSSTSTSKTSTNPTSQTSQKTSDSKKSDTASNSNNSTSSNKTNTNSSDSVIPEPEVKKAVVSKVYNLVSKSTLSVKEGDELDVGDNVITLSFEEAQTGVEYEILVNKTVATMVKSDDNKSFSYTYKASEGESLIIAVILKQATDESGHVITYTNGDHYTVLGITSGSKYKAYFDDENREQYDIVFAVIPDVGYHVKNVKLGDSDIDSKDNNITYSISEYDYFDSDKTLTVEVETVESHTITYVGNTAENGVDVTSSTLPTTFTGYDVVNFKFIALDGYAISDVTFSDDSISSYDSFSDYNVVLPNADITVTIVTVKKVTLRYQANEHIHDVEFYAGIDYLSNNIASGKDKITSFVPSDRNQFFVIFNCDSDYKPTGIDGSVDSGANGYDERVKTSDGKYVFRTYLFKDCELVFKLASKKTVSLDTSSTGVSLVFDNDKTQYFKGDSVGFDIIRDDETNTKVGEVTYSFVNTDGETETTVITPSTGSGHSYNFTMPDADVTIKVTLIQVSNVTLSYTNNASTYVKSVSFTGANSSANLNNNTTSSDSFEKGETVNFKITPNTDHSKKLKVIFTDSKGDTTEIQLTTDYSFKRYTGSFILTDAGSISIDVGDAATVRNVTANVCDGIEIEYYNSSKTKVDDLGSLYDLDIFYFTYKYTSDSDDRTMKYSVTQNGEVYNCSSTTINNEQVFQVLVKGDVVIKVEENTVETVSLTITGVTELDDDVLFTADDDPIDITKGKIEKNSLFYFDGGNIGVVANSVTIGGVVTSADYSIDHMHAYYRATGDVVINIGYEE